MLCTKVVTEGDSETARLVQMRNPWKREYFNVTWSYQSDEWTEELLLQARNEIKNDGIYFISIEDFVKNFKTTTVVHDVTDWHRSNFTHTDEQS